MNWGVKITIAFVLFAGFILYMVARSFQHEINLVSDSYYSEEINFQDRIDQKANLKAIGEEVKVSIISKDIVLLEFPEDHESANGEIHFYHVSHQLFDKKFPIQLDSIGQQRMNTEKLAAGRYRVKLSWEVGKEGYFQESEIFIK
ncbi:MAG: hypothetical protein GY816_05035 [Cytophagales bacterium]|nr:hypothetical protein [Cytophagales bacterium]